VKKPRTMRVPSGRCCLTLVKTEECVGPQRPCSTPRPESSQSVLPVRFCNTFCLAFRLISHIACRMHVRHLLYPKLTYTPYGWDACPPISGVIPDPCNDLQCIQAIRMVPSYVQLRGCSITVTLVVATEAFGAICPRSTRGVCFQDQV